MLFSRVQVRRTATTCSPCGATRMPPRMRTAAAWRCGGLGAKGLRVAMARAATKLLLAYQAAAAAAAIAAASCRSSVSLCRSPMRGTLHCRRWGATTWESSSTASSTARSSCACQTRVGRLTMHAIGQTACGLADCMRAGRLHAVPLARSYCIRCCVLAVSCTARSSCDVT